MLINTEPSFFIIRRNTGHNQPLFTMPGKAGIMRGAFQNKPGRMLLFLSDANLHQFPF